MFPNVTGDRTEKIKINHIPNPITSGDSEGCFKVREKMTSISWQDGKAQIPSLSKHMIKQLALSSPLKSTHLTKRPLIRAEAIFLNSEKAISTYSIRIYLNRAQGS